MGFFGIIILYFPVYTFHTLTSLLRGDGIYHNNSKELSSLPWGNVINVRDDLLNPPLPPLQKGELLSPFCKGGLRGIFQGSPGSDIAVILRYVHIMHKCSAGKIVHSVRKRS